MNDGFANTISDVYKIARRNGEIKEIHHNKIITDTGVVVHYYGTSNLTYISPRLREIYYCVEK